MQWTVEKLNDPMMMRGPMRGRPPVTEIVEADELAIDAGTLIFRTGGQITNAKGPGTWADVRPTPEDEA